MSIFQKNLEKFEILPIFNIYDLRFSCNRNKACLFHGREVLGVCSEKTHKTERLRKLKPFKLKKSRHRISKIELSLLEKFYTLYFKITKNLHLKKWKLLMD
jgi:hypothetical protein